MNSPASPLPLAVRSLAKSPAFTAIAVLILALGIGVNGAIFRLVDRVLLQPLPFRDPGRLVAISEAVPRLSGEPNPLSVPNFLDWQRGSSRLEAMAALYNGSLNLTGGGEPERVPTGRVSWNFFRILGVEPVLGRGFLAEEDRAGAPGVVILTHEFWTRRFGGDPSLVGRSIRLDGLDTQVVGILPPGFRFNHNVTGARVFVPAAFTHAQMEARGNHFMAAVGRLRPGATVAEAQEELQGIAAGLAKAYPDTNQRFTARVVPLQAQMVRNARGTLLVLAGAVGFVLLIACANLMNLMLARAGGRQREMAIRGALGASPGTLLWHAFQESLVLGLLGGIGGLFLGRWTFSALAGLVGSGITGPGTQVLDGRALLFTLLLSLGASFLFGLVPALQVENRHLADFLKEGKGSGGGSHPRLRALLVASETALATALLVGAGLMLRSFIYLQAVDPGFRPDHVLVTVVSLPDYKYPDGTSRVAFMRELQRRLQEAPGVAAPGVNDTCPLWGSTSSSSYQVGGQDQVEGQQALNHHITPGYFRAMGIPILQGRDLEPGETGAAVISEAMARRHFPGADPLAGSISFSGESQSFLPVVGVVGDVRHQSLAEAPVPEMYFPILDERIPSRGIDQFMVVLRTVPRPESMIPVLKKVLREMDPDLPLGSAQTMEATLARDREEAVSRSILLGAFALLALLLAGVGIFAVIQVLTGRRTREIGIRMALGARAQDVVRMVVGQGMRMALGGVAAGVGMALALGRLLESQIAGVTSRDPVTFACGVGILVLVAFLACLLPAMRAARVDPMTALRNE